MTAREFINFLHIADATENALLYSHSLLLAKGALSNWRLLRIEGYADVNDVIRFITINNFEDWNVKLDIGRDLYYTDIGVEHNIGEVTRVHISRGY